MPERSGEERKRYRRILEGEGYQVAEKTVKQYQLTGGSIDEEVTIASMSGRRGSARISVSQGGGKTTMTAVVHLSRQQDAARLAEKLEELGGVVDVDEERVSAKFRRVSPGVIRNVARETAKAIRGERENRE